MTLEQLHRHVLHFANGGYCRFWVHRNYPQNPATMAVQVMDYAQTPNGNFALMPVPINGMETLGFDVEDNNAHGKYWIYTVDRTNEDGTPFESKI